MEAGAAPQTPQTLFTKKHMCTSCIYIGSRTRRRRARRRCRALRPAPKPEDASGSGVDAVDDLRGRDDEIACCFPAAGVRPSEMFSHSCTPWTATDLAPTALAVDAARRTSRHCAPQSGRACRVERVAAPAAAELLTDIAAAGNKSFIFCSNLRRS